MSEGSGTGECLLLALAWRRGPGQPVKAYFDYEVRAAEVVILQQAKAIDQRASHAALTHTNDGASEIVRVVR